MATQGWKQLTAGGTWCHGEGRFPIAAYSEYMPPPRLGRKPYDGVDTLLFSKDDARGWHINEYEQAIELRPGLERLAKRIVSALVHLGRGESAHGIARAKLADNPYWPPALAEHAGKLAHERYVILMPLALSRTQDDKGRIRWTFFGGSEQGPARAFWKSFYSAPGSELPEEQALDFIRRLLSGAYELPMVSLADLHGSGFRILPQSAEPALPFWHEDALPAWTKPYLWTPAESQHAVKYLLTFQPFAGLPAQLQQAYLSGKLHLLPFPGSLLFWGAQPYLRLQRELPLAPQIPLQHLTTRHEGWRGLRIPQSGWLHEPRPNAPAPDAHHGPVRNTYKRTHRWARVLRNEDELAALTREDKLAHVLFSSMPEDIGLYGKPMARNAQLWTHDFNLLLDGPQAGGSTIRQATCALSEGGMFGYRFLFPAMRVGTYEVFWHRPLVAYLSQTTGEPAIVADGPKGYLTAYKADRPNLAKPIELWPRFLERAPHVAAIRLFDHENNQRSLQATINIRKLLDSQRLLGERPLPRSFARRLLTMPKSQSLDEWLASLPEHASDPQQARHLAEELHAGLEPDPATMSPGEIGTTPSLTFGRTALRSFEEAYWKTIRLLAEGRYVNKDNADCIHDPITRMQLMHHQRDLEALGDYLLDYYTRKIAEARMTGKALAGDLPFTWQTDFDFSWSGGWVNNQEGVTHERDIIVVIPGRDRRRAVIMADHYDTAYMADHYEKESGGNGARLAAAGADDNHSATAALMLGAPLFLELSRQGKLDCDIWLVHLTGEEFPADCLGARHLCQWLVEGNLKMRLAGGGKRDLSRTRVQGVYVLDMVAHNNDHDRDVFQISPGSSSQSLWLAYQAHLANEAWNASTGVWNRRPSRRGRGRGRRSPDGATIPAVAQHPQLLGEVRPSYDPRSTLYNTDGQIFSDAGVPVVLFMENYDINRTGYHDSHDTMENIDLDYGAGVAAIAIETVARAATEKPMEQVR